MCKSGMCYLQGQNEKTPHSIKASEYMPERAYLNKVNFSHPSASSSQWFVILHIKHQSHAVNSKYNWRGSCEIMTWQKLVRCPLLLPSYFSVTKRTFKSPVTWSCRLHSPIRLTIIISSRHWPMYQYRK